MSMRCRACGKEIDIQNNYIICEDCETMYFTNITALQSFLKQKYDDIRNLSDASKKLHQKQLNDSKSTTIAESKVLETEKQYISLKDEIEFLKENKYQHAQEREWAEKLYKFNKTADFIIDYYSSNNM